MKLFQHRFTSMGCPCRLQLYATTRHQARQAFEKAQNEIDRLDFKYSHYRADSQLHRIQHEASKTDGTLVDQETAALLDYSGTQFCLSGGLFDITTHHLTALWNQASALPTEREINEALNRTGWQKIEWDGRRLRIPRGMRFDLGGVVKEYAADRAATVLLEAGFRSGCIDLGGDLHVLGPHPDDSPWIAGIRNPDGSGHAIADVEIHQGGLATSGNYERFTEIDGQRYGHVINPQNGWPVNVTTPCLASVSVIAPTCLLAGSLTTLALLPGQEQGLALLTESGLPWLAIDEEGMTRGSLKI